MSWLRGLEQSSAETWHGAMVFGAYAPSVVLLTMLDVCVCIDTGSGFPGKLDSVGRVER